MPHCVDFYLCIVIHVSVGSSEEHKGKFYDLTGTRDLQKGLAGTNYGWGEIQFCTILPSFFANCLMICMHAVFVVRNNFQELPCE